MIIIYNLESEEIIIAVNSNFNRWDTVLIQIVNRKRYPARYESGIWSPQKQKYNIIKRKCRGVFIALKKFRLWIYGVYFIIETDTYVLIV